MSIPRLTPATLTGVVGVVFAGAIFGFFYAWLCSTLWGLDLVDPATAIEAMQAMNASVRNPVFFAGFFVTPVVLAVAALLAWQEQRRTMASLFGGAAVLYTLGCIMWTTLVNLPLNAGLAEVSLPVEAAEAAAIWSEYSADWQWANLVRTVVSGLSLGMVGLGLLWSARSVQRDPRPEDTAANPSGISQGTHSVPSVNARIGA